MTARAARAPHDRSTSRRWSDVTQAGAGLRAMAAATTAIPNRRTCSRSQQPVAALCSPRSRSGSRSGGKCRPIWIATKRAMPGPMNSPSRQVTCGGPVARAASSSSGFRCRQESVDIVDEHEAVFGNDDATDMWQIRRNATGVNQRIGHTLQQAGGIVDQQDGSAAFRKNDQEVIRWRDFAGGQREAPAQIEYG